MTPRRLVPGSIVLNQCIDDPMSGEVVGYDGDHIRVKWVDGRTCSEWPTDITLTAFVDFEG